MLKKTLCYIHLQDYDYIKSISRSHGDFSQFVRSAVAEKVEKHRGDNAISNPKRKE